MIATGGTTITSAGYTIHTFNSDGTFEVTAGSGDVEVLVVAGGGGGGSTSGGSGAGGGGGAGGLVFNSAYAVAVGSYTVTVGAGGTGKSYTGGAVGAGGDGNDSVFDTITAKAGGGGGSSGAEPNGRAGGSGGGAGTEGGATGGVENQGDSGGGTGFGSNGGASDSAGSGVGGGGGGGAGAVGTAGSNPPYTGGPGGVGKEYSISGSATYYAGGGGGSSYGVAGGAGGNGGGGAGSSGSGGNGVAGTANTGGGGGGGCLGNGANGGSGVVVVRYYNNAEPATPTNSTPTNGATGVSRNPTLTGSAFSDIDDDDHYSSQWQVATDSGFSSVVWDSGEEVGSNLTSIEVNTTNGTFAGALSGKTKLATSTAYYFRVKYKDDGSNTFSAYSSGTSFTVRAGTVIGNGTWVEDPFGKYPKKVSKLSMIQEYEVAPTETPTGAKIVVDSDTNRLYVYVNGAWKYVALS